MKIHSVPPLLLASLFCAGSLHAAIDIVSPAVPDPFPAIPPTDRWTTLRVGTEDDTTITSAAVLDERVIRDTDATAVLNALLDSATIPPSVHQLSRQNRGTNTNGITFLQMRPTEEAYQLLLAHLSNATANPLTSVQVAYEYSKATSAPNELIKGLRVYSSLTGAPGSWTLVPALSVDANGTYDAPQLMNTSVLLSSPVAPGGTVYLLFADHNADGTDSSYHIRNFAVSPGLDCSISATATDGIRSAGANAADPADDTVSFSLTVQGEGSVSPAGWTITAPAALAGTTGAYGAATAIPSAPVSAFVNGVLQVKIVDSTLTACETTVSLRTQHVIGTNAINNSTILSTVPPVGWTVDDATRVSTQAASTAQADRIIESQPIDLSGTGYALFEADLTAISGASSGFETADSFGIELAFDGGAAIPVVGAADVDASGRLTGRDGTASPELPGATEVNTTETTHFSFLIPEAASSVQIRIIGSSNSPAETYEVKNVAITPFPTGIYTERAALPVLNNQGTVAPGDDTITATVNIFPVNLGASTGWDSNETPSRSGLYAAANPVTFGPYPATGPATLILTDDANPAVSSKPLVLAPQVPLIQISAPANVTRQPHGPGAADDTVSFEVSVTGTGGPQWSTTNTTPATGNSDGSTVTLTVPAPGGVASVPVIFTDASYPAVAQTVNVNFPAVYILGQANLNGTPIDVISEPVAAPNTAWTNDAAARTITLTDGDVTVAGDKTITSQPINLSGIAGDVTFTANLHVTDLTTGFEAADTFNAYLIYDGDTATPISLITPHDTSGNSILEGTELAPAMNPAARQDKDYALSKTIPDSVNSVQLVIVGNNDSANETMVVGSVQFTAGATPVSDADGDGVSDASELIMGTSPADAGDVLRLTQNPANPTQITFPSKAGRFYRVYVSDDTDGQEGTHLAVWKNANLGTITGDGNPKQFDISVLPAEKRRFFRLHVMESDGGAGGWPATYP